MQRRIRALSVAQVALIVVAWCAHAHAVEARAAASAAGADAPRSLSGPPEAETPFDFAYEACLQKQEGTTCSVSFDGHEIDGRCVRALDNRLFCLPDSF